MTLSAMATAGMLDEHDAARIIGKSTGWMRQARWRGIGPRYIKIGRNCRYRAADLHEYLAGCVVGTADQPAQANHN